MLTADNMNYFVVLLPSADQVFVSRATYEVVYQKSLEEYERLANLPRRYILRASPQLLSSDPRVQKPYGYQGDGKTNTGKKRRVDKYVIYDMCLLFPSTSNLTRLHFPLMKRQTVRKGGVRRKGVSKNCGKAYTIEDICLSNKKARLLSQEAVMRWRLCCKKRVHPSVFNLPFVVITYF